MSSWTETYKKDRERKVFKNKWEELRLRPITGPDGKPKAEDGRIAQIRFLTDPKEVENVWVHEVPKTGRLGKRYNETIYCEKLNDRDEKAGCEWCDKAAAGGEGMWPKRKLYFWVYVYRIFHINQSTKEKWEREEYLDEKYYVEPVNGVRLLVTGVGKGNATEEKFLNWAKRFKTLMDRDYDWERHGLGFDVTYDLTPKPDASEMPPEVKTAIKNLIPLSEVMGEMRKQGINGAKSSKAEEPVGEEIESIFK